MKTLVVSLTLIFGVLLVSATLLAHHGEANYDTSKVVSVKGTVTDFQFINPHVQISLDVKNDKGEIEKWVGEARSPSMLSRIGGWDKNTIKIGERNNRQWPSNYERNQLPAPYENRPARRPGDAESVGARRSCAGARDGCPTRRSTQIRRRPNWV